MTKGEAYRAYYLANKEHILQANKERATKRKEARRESPEEEEKHRETVRVKEATRRRIHNKATLEALSEVATDKEWSSLYSKLATHPTIDELTPKMMTFLQNLYRVPTE